MAETRLEQLLALLKTEPEDAFLNHALAMEYLGMGEEQKAIETMEKVIHFHPDHTGTYYHLGHALLRANKRDEALAVWQLGIQKCKELKKQHHLAELQSAYNEVLFEDD
ncbi:MAG: tetratricopeptide repeat protein [Bacteroidetes bacterium]|nr:tetratricopeptide repeat protein [Bacteroidota bacterium]